MSRAAGRRRAFPGDASDPHGLHRACVDFLNNLEVRHYSPRTVEGFRDSLAVFVGWADQRGVTRPVEVTRPVLEAYQRHLFWRRKPDGSPMSNQTQCSRVVPIRGPFGFLVRQNRVLANPASDLQMPKVDQRLPRAVLTVRGRAADLRDPGRRPRQPSRPVVRGRPERRPDRVPSRRQPEHHRPHPHLTAAPLFPSPLPVARAATLEQ